MLVLGRKPGQRTRITTPCGVTIWATMGDRCIIVDDGLDDPLTATAEDHVWLEYDDGEVCIVYNPQLDKYGAQKLGICAPVSFLVLREELIIEK